MCQDVWNIFNGINNVMTDHYTVMDTSVTERAFIPLKEQEYLSNIE